MPTIRLMLVVGLLLAAACGAEPPSAPGSPSDTKAPDFTLQTFADGTFALSEQRGTVVVLNFFESW